MKLVKKYQTSEVISKGTRDLLSDHTGLQRSREHITTLDQERPFLCFVIIWQVLLSSFHTTSLKYQVIHTHNLTQHKGDRDIFFRTVKWHLQNVSKEWQRHFFSPNKENNVSTRTLQDYCISRGEAVKINPKQN